MKPSQPDTFDPTISAEAPGALLAMDTWADDSSAGVTQSHPSVGQETPGRYRSIDDAELGRGGIGRVLIAFDSHLGREIAVKELLAAGTSTGRFLREARVTAQLEHPNIVPVYELGRRADGTLYYTMKRVRGRTLAAALEAADTMQERLRLLGHFVDTCQAIAYAHSRGVVHRDIKPHNIMVGEFGETVLLDWGLAKVKGQQDLRGVDLEREVALFREAESYRTLQGATMGTPAYMSPEQARGRIGEVDERSDVWSLGAVLFEILAGVPPFVGRNPMETLAKVLNEPTPRIDEAPPDLANVCMKALARDPEKRYATARELAEDIIAWQSGGRVKAHAYTLWEIVGKYVSRNRGVVSAIGLVAAVLLVVAGVAGARVLSEQADHVAAARAMDRALAEAQTEAAWAALASGDAPAAARLADASNRRHPTPEAVGAIVAARGGWFPERLWTEDIREQVLAVSIDAAGTTVAVATPTGVWARKEGSERLARLDVSGEGTGAIAFSGEDAVTADATGRVVAWQPGGEVRRRLRVEGDVIRAVAASSGGGFLAAGEGGDVRIWGPAGDVPRTKFRAHGGPVSALASGTALFATVSEAEGRARVWAGDERRLDVAAHAAAVALSRDDATLAVVGAPRGQDGVVELIDVASGRMRTLTLAGAHPVSLALSSDLLAAGATDGTVRVWALSDLAPIGRLPTASSPAIAFDASGRRLAVAAPGGELSVWSVPSPGRAVRASSAIVAVGEKATASAAEAPLAAIVPTGIALAGPGGATLRPFEGAPVRLTSQPVTAIAVDGERLAIAAGEAVQIVDGTGGVVGGTGPLGSSISGVALRGDVLVIVHDNAAMRLFRGLAPVAQEEARSWRTGRPAISPDGKRFAIGTGDGAVRIYRIDGRAFEQEIVHEGHRSLPAVLAWSPDGDGLASGATDGELRLWSGTTNVLAIPAHAGAVRSIAWTVDGGTILTGGEDGGVGRWGLVVE